MVDKHSARYYRHFRERAAREEAGWIAEHQQRVAETFPNGNHAPETSPF